MWTYLFRLSVFTVALGTVALSPGCDEARRSNYYDLGDRSFKHIGDPCQPDVAPSSECGYWPQFYCSANGSCASACNSNADCSDNSACVGSSSQTVGECRLASTPVDAGTDL